MTGASLGVTGVIAGGAYLSSGLKEQANHEVLRNPQNLSALGARAVDVDERRNEQRVDRSSRTDRQEQQQESASAGAEGSELADRPEEDEDSSESEDSADTVSTATVNGVIDRSAAQERRAEEREAERREQLESADPREVAQALLEQRGMGEDEFSCLDSLWEKESGWSTDATNPSSGAYGIPQALPGEKMAEFGDDWEWNPRTQIEWGLEYIDSNYGTPCSAWAHSQSTGWY